MCYELQAVNARGPHRPSNLNLSIDSLHCLTTLIRYCVDVSKRQHNIELRLYHMNF